jgi:hypothetical protein
MRNVKYLNSTKIPTKIGEDVRNDTNMSLEAVQAHFAAVGSVEISYGDIVLEVEPRALEDCKKVVAAMSVEERAHVMQSVDKALRKNAKAVEGNKAAKKVYDDFHGDLLLWTALQEYTA